MDSRRIIVAASALLLAACHHASYQEPATGAEAASSAAPPGAGATEQPKTAMASPPTGAESQMAPPAAPPRMGPPMGGPGPRWGRGGPPVAGRGWGGWGPGGQMRGMHMPSAVYSPGFVLAHAEELKLSEEQTQKIQQDMYATREKMIDLRARAMKARVALRRMLAEPKVDQRAVDREIDAAASATAAARKLQVQMWLRTRDTLTLDQQKQLAQLRAGAWPGRARWRGRMSSK